MRILLCTPTFDGVYHGPAKFARLMLRVNDIYDEHEIRILTEDYENGDAEKIYKTTISPFRFLPLGKFRRMFAYYFEAKKIYADWQYDVILFNDAIHGLWSASFLSGSILKVGMLNDEASIRSSIFNLSLNKMDWVHFTHRYFEKLALKQLDITFVNSAYLKKLAVTKYKSEEDRIKVLYKSIDLDRFKYHSHSSIDLEKEIKVLFVKNDFRTGGFNILIEALSILGEFNFEVTVIGPLEEEKLRIEKLLNNITSVSLRFLGPRTQDTVAREMHQNDILCVPSISEGLGVANIEGLACGIPVVSSDAGGIPEVLQEGKYGWLSKCGDADSLASAIKACLLNEGKRINMSEQARTYVCEKFDYKIMLQHLLDELQHKLN